MTPFSVPACPECRERLYNGTATQLQRWFRAWLARRRCVAAMSVKLRYRLERQYELIAYPQENASELALAQQLGIMNVDADFGGGQCLKHWLGACH